MTTGSSKWIRRSRRLAIYARDGWRCVWCTSCVYLPVIAHPAPQHATLDHVRSRDDGGTHKSENLVTCCARCNALRRGLSAFDFAGELFRRGFIAYQAKALGRVLDAITKPLPGRRLDVRAVAATQRAVASTTRRPRTKARAAGKA